MIAKSWQKQRGFHCALPLVATLTVLQIKAPAVRFHGNEANKRLLFEMR